MLSLLLYAVLGLAALAAVTYFYVRTFLLSDMRTDWLKGVPQVDVEPHWLLGHLLALKGTAKTPNLIKGMEELFVRKNPSASGFARFWFFQQKAIVLLNSAHVKIALQHTNHRELVPLIGGHMRKLLGEKSIALLSTLEPGQWKAHRTMVMEGFRVEHIKTMVGDMDDVAAKLIKTLLTRTDAATQQGQPFQFDLFQAMKMATMDAIGLTGFGVDFACCERFEYSPVASAFEFLLDDQSTRSAGANILDPRKLWYGYPSAQNRKSRECTTLLRGTLQQLMRQKQAQIDKGDQDIHKDFLYLMLLANSESKLTYDALIDNLITLLFGGYDTTSIALSYAIYLLFKHPEAERRLVAEAREVLGGGAAVDALLVKKLKYTTAVFKEAMRLFPPAPVTARHTTKPMRIDDVVVPPDVLIYIPIWWIHRSELNWDRPNEFDPTRFLRSDSGANDDEPEPATATDTSAAPKTTSPRSGAGAGAGPGSGQPAPYSWLPFSGGQRNCVGQRFAMMEGPLVLAKVMLAMKFSFPEGYEPLPVSSGPVQKPSVPMCVTTERRGASD